MTTTGTTKRFNRMLERIAKKPEALATLRRGVGRPLEDSPGSWPFVIAAAGDHHYRQEVAHVVLGLFALHHQSQEPGAMNVQGQGFGEACAVLALRRAQAGGSATGVNRRFQAALAAETLTALAVHLSGLVTMLRDEKVPLDYSKLFWNLLAWGSLDYRNSVALGWARDYFRIVTNNEQEEATS